MTFVKNMRCWSLIAYLLASSVVLLPCFARDSKPALPSPLILGGQVDNDVAAIRELYAQRPLQLTKVDALKTALLAKYADASPQDMGRICAELCMALDQVSPQDQSVMADKQGLAFICLRDHMPPLEIALRLAMYLRIGSPTDSANPGQCVKLWISIWKVLESEIDPAFNPDLPVSSDANGDIWDRHNHQLQLLHEKLFYKTSYGNFLAAYVRQQKFDLNATKAFLEDATLDEDIRQSIVQLSKPKN